ncbi:MAG TPA: isoprenyl transferase [Bacteroidota bacterium]|nr:isoprenyl transferase [Bacteroidota bacterium]
MKFKESPIFRRRPADTAGKPDSERQADIRRRGNIPVHIAVIMDGNGRWAQNRGLPRIAGHSEGVESVRDTVEACGQLGVQHLTLYAFSIENWKRPDEEVSLLMRLLMRALRDETDKLHRNNVRVSTIGETASLPREVRDELADSIRRTEKNTGLNLCLALSYSGRWDITGAARAMISAAWKGDLDPAKITEETFAAYLSTHDMPDPDLLIRTSGERRISNFLLWQTAYSEIYISGLFWPEFRRDELYRAIEDYQHRERRFGMVSEQVQTDRRPPPPERIELKNVSEL